LGIGFSCYEWVLGWNLKKGKLVVSCVDVGLAEFWFWVNFYSDHEGFFFKLSVVSSNSQLEFLALLRMNKKSFVLIIIIKLQTSMEGSYHIISLLKFWYSETYFV
jgi:hypothetical protein